VRKLLPIIKVVPTQSDDAERERSRPIHMSTEIVFHVHGALGQLLVVRHDRIWRRGTNPSYPRDCCGLQQTVASDLATAQMLGFVTGSVKSH